MYDWIISTGLICWAFAQMMVAILITAGMGFVIALALMVWKDQRAITARDLAERHARPYTGYPDSQRKDNA